MKKPKNVRIYQIVLILIIFLGAMIRASILGWLFFVGILSWIFFSFIHYRFHRIVILNYDKIFHANRGLLILSHLIYLCLFLFQSDAGDDRTYIAIEEIIGKVSLIDLESVTWIIFTIAVIVYAILIGIIIFRINTFYPKINAPKRILKTVGYSIIIVSIPIIIMWVSIYTDEIKDRNKSENIGEYEDLKRALKNKEQVKKLRLYEYPNSYTEIPSEVFELTSIKELEMYSNKVAIIPKEISQLTELEILNLRGNSIKKIPKEIGRLNSLNELYLGQNEVVEISDSICKCQKLSRFDVSGKQLDKIPRCLKNIKDLDLSIQSDSINSIMRQLMEFEDLKQLRIRAYNGKNIDRQLLNELKEKLVNVKFPKY